MAVARRHTHFVSCALSTVLTVVAATAQHPALTPTADTTIAIATAAPLRYSSIHVPAGVTVRFVVSGGGPQYPGMPAVVLCDGDAIVHGTLSVAGDVVNIYPAGWVETGEGSVGYECTSSFLGGSYYEPPGGGRHAGEYGTVVPFSLDGGSPGGILFREGDLFNVPCGQITGFALGDQGGGTLALVALGRIEVGGAVTADGHHPGYLSSRAGGSGGSILLRGLGGVSVLPGGSVTARGGTASGAHPTTFGAPGYVRLDAWGASPDVQGTVMPVPTLVELPLLRIPTPPQIGGTCVLQVFAPQGTSTWIGVSLQPGPGTATPFGPLGIDAANAAVIAVVAIGLQSGPQHDQRESVVWPVPNAPALVGLPLWFQGFTNSVNLAPRLTNAVATVVQ